MSDTEHEPKAPEAAASEGEATDHPAAKADGKSSFFFVRWMRWLYDWVMSWSDRKGGTVALGAISFCESSFFPIPPDPLMVAMCLGNQKRSMFYATVTTISSVLGAVAGWAIGLYFFTEVVDWVLVLTGSAENWYGTVESLSLAKYAGKEAIQNQGMTLYPDGMLYSAKEMFDEYGIWALIVAAVTPIPFKVATVASGFFSMGIGPVFFGSLIGRGGRFWTMGLVFHFFGEFARKYIEKYFAPICIIGAIVGVGGFIAIKYLF